MEFPDAGYAMVVDLTFADGSMQYDAYTTVFNPGTHMWQAKIIKIQSEKSITSVTIHLIFKNHKVCQLNLSISSLRLFTRVPHILMM